MSTLTPGGRNPPTLEEVAARAGVSRATASRVLRGASDVSEQARNAVLSAAEDIVDRAGAFRIGGIMRGAVKG